MFDYFRYYFFQRYNVWDRLIIFLFLCCVFFLPFDRLISSYFIAILCTLAILNFFVFWKLNFQFTNTQKYFFITQLLFFLLMLVSFAYTSNTKQNLEILGRHISVLILPVIIFYFKDVIRRESFTIVAVFVIANVIAAVFCYANAIYNFFYAPKLSWGSYFFYNWFSVLTHSTYFAFYSNFSVAILFVILDVIWKQKRTLFKIICILFIVFLSFTIYLLSSRAGLLSLLIIITWRIIKFFVNYKNLKLKIAIVILFATFIVISLQNYRVQAMIKELKAISNTKDEKVPSRMIIWKNSLDVFLNNFWLGTSPADATKELDKNMLEKYNFQKAVDKHFNSHNQFLQNAVEYGIVGLLILLTMLSLAFIVAFKSKNTILLWFLVLLVFNFLFESMFEVAVGIIYIFFFINFLVLVFEKRIFLKHIDKIDFI